MKEEARAGELEVLRKAEKSERDLKRKEKKKHLKKKVEEGLEKDKDFTMNNKEKNHKISIHSNRSPFWIDSMGDWDRNLGS